MSRPTTKSELADAAEKSYATLCRLTASMTAAEQNGVFPFEDRDKNLRDVLIHLYEWHLLLLHWVEENRHGRETPFLPHPYNWKTYPAMNAVIWQKHQATPLQTAKEFLSSSHSQVMALIDTFSNDKLFVKKYFSYTGSTSLGSYMVSATSAHYGWAVKKLKKYLNARHHALTL